MPQIALISPFEDIASLGNRHIGAYLKHNGFEVRYLFLPIEKPEVESTPEAPTFYSKATLQQMTELCTEAAIIGITVMTDYFVRAAQMSTHLRETLGKPIVWGGIHPTVRPDECLDFADLIVIGEGEEAMLELSRGLLDGKAINAIENIGYKKNNAVIKNPARPLLQDLDAYPAPDYSLNDDWLLGPGGTVKRMGKADFHQHLDRGVISRILERTSYQTMTGRGCPKGCSFCCNNALRRIYKGQRYTRMRSVEHVIEELVRMKTEYPFIKAIGFSDDSFFTRKVDDFAKLMEAYKKEVDLPFNCLVVPGTTTEDKVKLALDAGLVYIQMGIQTASKRMKKIYRRYESNEKILETIGVLNKYAHRMHPPVFDFLINNPLEGTEDHLETLDFLHEMPYPYRLQLFSLVPFPGTELQEIFTNEGLLSAEDDSGYQRRYDYRQMSYVNVLYALYRRNVSKRMMKILTKPYLVHFLQKPFFTRLGNRMYHVISKVRKNS